MTDMGVPVTLTGSYGTADVNPGEGYVDIVPMVSQANEKIIVVQDPVRAELDGEGKFSVDIYPSDDSDWRSGPVPYIFRENVDGRISQWMAYVYAAGPYDISDLIPLDEAPDMYIPVPGPPNVLTVQSVITVEPEVPADVKIYGTSPSQELEFYIPRGQDGAPGPSGAPHIGPDEPTDPNVTEWFDTDEESPRGVRVEGDTMLGALHLAAGSTAPTPTLGDDSTLVATTAFVADAVAAGGGVTSVNGETGDVVLDAADVGAAGLDHSASHAIGGTDALALSSLVHKVAASGAAQTVPVTHDMVDITMSANCNITFPTPTSAGHVFVLVLRGAFTPTLPASVDWSGGTAPTYTSPSVYVFSTVDGGTTWLGAQTGKAFA